ncbi:MAG: FtsB family cell division protein [Bacteroidota bacterium]
MKKILKTIWPYLRNKYIVTITLFLVWIVFLSKYNLVERVRMINDIKGMERDIQYYQEQIARDSTRLKELTTSRDNLEKYAREQYYMKKKNEDIFVIIDK